MSGEVDEVTLQDAEEIVTTLNEELEGKTGDFEGEIEFNLMTNGFEMVIDFCGIRIWSTMDDERRYIDDDGNVDPEGVKQESLERWVRFKSKRLFATIISL